MLKKLAVFLVLLTCAAGLKTVEAQSVAPDGTNYTPASHLDGYRWVANARAVFADENVILRTGLMDWEADSPITCKYACDAFMSCKAFQFHEPALLTDKPSCRLLTGATDLSVEKGVHVYILR
ncbi:MAG: hypothetical protein CMK09_02445 [Ponticaulis sp.]|nr:hypothetical protein [Ponticaulis sp.]|tara:strand:- start:17073 stop:17441 length:369 start_codon:yes stop_codon:yes gene_type:complete